MMGVADLTTSSPKRSLFKTLQSRIVPGLNFDQVHCVYVKLFNRMIGCTAGGYLSQIEKFNTCLGLEPSYFIFAGTEQLSIMLLEKDTTM